MTVMLIKHGTEQGYREELKTGDVCTRCRNGHREFDRQYSKKYKTKGIRYRTDQVLDHLYAPTRRGRPVKPVPDPVIPVNPARETAGNPAETAAVSGQASLGQRLSDALSAAVGRTEAEPGNDYVTTDDPPDYLSRVDPDPDPVDSEYQPEPEAEYVLNSAGMEKIEENLGTYLSIVGMTAEMIDPYCGSILADNFDNIVKKWTKVIAHYPKAAELFLDGKGGVIMNWIGALQATWPVLMAIYHHHLARDIQVKDGRIFRRDNAQHGSVDPTMPPMPDDFDYSAV